jgi:polar amino acid transport system permease protein
MIKYDFNFNVVAINRMVFLKAAGITLEVSIFAIIIGFLIGLVFASIKSHKIKVLSGFVTAYVEIIRNTPFLIQLFVIYFVLPLIGIKIDPLPSGIIALSINCGGYATEIIRAGMESIHKDQTDAGVALGMNRFQVLRYVILYPSLQKMFPALSTLFIALMLGSSVLTAISAPELTSVAFNITTYYYRHFEIFIFISGVYLFFSIILSIIFKIIENRFLSYEKENQGFKQILKNVFKGSLIGDRSKLDTGKI